MMTEDIVGQIYEAALVPERWPAVLDHMGALAHSIGGALLATGARHPPRWSASAPVAGALRSFVESGRWRHNERRVRWLAQHHRGFLRDVDIFTPEEIDRSHSPRPGMVTSGLGWQLGTLIPMPSGEDVIISLERRFEEGPHDTRVILAVDALHPHLARAGLLAARLGLERARTVVATLEAIGLPAAVLTASGRAIAVNAMLEALTPTLLPGAHGRLTIANAPADALLREAVAAAPNARQPAVLSIPVPGREDRPPMVLHVLPVRGAAHDIFSGAATLLIATTVGMSENIPGLDVLRGLFDLSPREAKLAGALAAGTSLKAAAEGGGITFGTARSYLESIFRKTGTNQQSQLVALLKSAGPIAGAS